MSQMQDQLRDVKDDARDRMSGDLDSLRNHFNKLREDITALVGDALGAAKQSAGVVGGQGQGAVGGAVGNVKQRVDELKDRGNQQMDQLTHAIQDNPVASALIAFGVGFVAAKILTRR